MKVYIGPYKNWVGPYQIAEALCFWAKPVKDEYNFERKPDWVHNFGTWLSHGTTDEKITDSKNPPKTWLSRLCQWIESKRSRTTYIKIDKYDTWSMDHTLAIIILPMLKQLQATKHGAPGVDDEDVPEGLNLRSTEAPPKENEWDTDENWHKRWDWVMDEMIFAFEHHVDTKWEEAYSKGEWSTRSEACQWDENGKPKMFKMVYNDDHTHETDYEALKVVHERIANGFKLFGKYYRNLWD